MSGRSENIEMVCAYVKLDDYRMARTVLLAEVSGERVRDRPRFCWMDGVRWPLATEE